MKRILKDGTQVEVFGAKRLPYGIPGTMLCGQHCPLLGHPNAPGEHFTCSIHKSLFIFPHDAEQIIPPGESKTPYRSTVCLSLDPDKDALDTLWTLVIIDLFNKQPVTC